MRVFAQRRAEVASYLVVALAASFIVVLALRADGNTRHEVDLNDGGVYVSSNEDRSFGRLNKPIDELDGTARITTGGAQDLDIVQEGSAVVGLNLTTSEVSAISPADLAIGQVGTSTIAGASSVALNGGTLVVVDRSTGKVWATLADPTYGFSSMVEVDATSEERKVVGADASGTALESGSVVAVSAEADRLVILDPAQGFAVTEDRSIELAGTPQVTAVGDVPVVLDTGSGMLYLKGGATATVPVDAVLQQPGPAAGTVLVTTSSALLAVELDSGQSTVLVDEQSGAPSAAVRVGTCAYTAWSGDGADVSGAVATVCEGGDPVVSPVPGSELVIRENRGQVLLNDRLTGAVYNIDDDKPRQVDNWESYAPQKVKQNNKNDNPVDNPLAAEQPPKAEDDRLGARPGTTTVLHVLDNDQAPAKQLLAINATTEPSLGGVTAQISPDAQTILLEVPRDAEGTVKFKYTVDAGHDKTDTADVVVEIKGEESQESPRLREGFDPVADGPKYRVVINRSILIPVLGDWRDPAEGDPISLTEILKVSDGKAVITAAGQIRYEAPPDAGRQHIVYRVTDSTGQVSKGSVNVRVLGLGDDTYSPIANPDVGRGTVGSPILVRALDNDTPGADPFNSDAALNIAEPVKAASGLQVTTDRETGRLTIVGSRPGTFELTYKAGYGDAVPKPAVIRVDVDKAPEIDSSPVTVPDTLTLFGTAQGVVDVLANDYDPRGQVLVTQGAEVLTENHEPIEVSVIDGRWVRVRATGPVGVDQVTVRYTVTNGINGSVTGDISVRLAPSAEDEGDHPVTTEDHALVRSGGSVAIPVLDNDFTPSGLPVQLAAGSGEAKDGYLTVTPELGKATVSGRFVRFTADTDVSEPRTVTVAYVATNAAGNSQEGIAHIRITPPISSTRANQPPTPPTVEARVVAGELVRIKLPAGTADPDGDAITVTGIGSATALGRVTKFGATEIQYEAFPTSAGTDTFEYEVTDPGGAVATGTIRVAVVPPDQMQAPIAVDDTLDAAPGRTVTIRPLSNDYIAAGDQVKILPLDESNSSLPDGVSLESETGPITIRAGEHTVQMRYQITNGVSISTGTITVRTVKDYNNPPVVFDAYGKLAGAEASSVTLNVLEKAYDPDGQPEDVKLISVAEPQGDFGESDGESDGGADEESDGESGEESSPAVNFSADGKVTVALGSAPQVLGYTARDKDRAVASGFLYIPASPADGLRLVSDDTLLLEAGGKLTLDVNDLVTDSDGKQVRLTTLETDQSASPASALSLRGTGRTTLELSATDAGYVGPGSISFQVTNGETIGEEGADTRNFTLPVQVGDPQPVFRCPDTPLHLQVGGTEVAPDFARFCHIWTPKGDTALELAAEPVSQSLEDLQISAQGTVIELAAPSTMKPTRNPGELRITDPATGANGVVLVRVTDPGPPRLAPVVLEGLEAGQSRTIDMADYLTSPLGNADPTVVDLRANRGVDARASKDGSRITITPNSSGRMRWNVTVADVDPTRQGREAYSSITLDVQDVPARPAAPIAVADDRQVALKWAAPDDHGSKITKYLVKFRGEERTCFSTTCTITGLENTEPYSFTVTAINGVGPSQASPKSKTVTPDDIPGAIENLKAGVPRDRKILLSWDPPSKQTSILDYRLSWPGHSNVSAGTKTSFQVTTDSNNRTYTVTVKARNKLGYGPPRLIEIQTSGRPDAPVNVTATGVDGAVPEQAAVTITWQHSNWEGPVGHYLVRRNDGKQWNVPATSHQTSDAVAYDGKKWTYQVFAINGTTTNVKSHTSAAGVSNVYRAAGQPTTPVFTIARPTGQDNMGTYRFRAGQIRGSSAHYELQLSQTLTGKITTNQVITLDRANTGPNGTAVNGRVRVCNAEKLCSAWAAAPNPVTPYGPLRNSDISAWSSRASGQTVNFSFRVDNNGRPATVRITGSRNYGPRVITVTGRNQLVTGSHQIGYSSTEKFTITLSDSTRGPIKKSFTSPKTEPKPKPKPKVTVSKGGSAQGEPGCGGSACRWIVVTTSNFPGRVSCHATVSSTPNHEVPEWGDWSQGPNERRVTTKYYGQPGQWVNVKCGGYEGRITW